MDVKMRDESREEIEDEGARGQGWEVATSVCFLRLKRQLRSTILEGATRLEKLDFEGRRTSFMITPSIIAVAHQKGIARKKNSIILKTAVFL